MPIGPREIDAVLRRVASVVRDDSDLESTLADIHQLVACEILSPVIQRHDLEEWAACVDEFVRGSADRTGSQAVMFVCLAWAIHCQLLQYAPERLSPRLLQARASLRWSLAKAAERLPQLQLAEVSYGQAASDYGRLGNLLLRARCLANQALFVKELGNAKTAYGLLQEALVVFEREFLPVEAAITQMNQAGCLQDLGRMDAALALYERSWPTIERHGTEARQALHLGNHAGGLQGAGRPGEALSLFRRAAMFFAKPGVGTVVERAECQAATASCLQDLGRLNEALADYEQSLNVLEDEAPPLVVANVRMNYATCLRETRQYQQALSQYRRARRILEEEGAEIDLARCLMNQGVTEANLGNREEARALYRMALPTLRATGRVLEVAVCQLDAALCAVQPAERMAGLDQALRTCEEIGSAADETRWRVLRARAELWEQLNHRDRAIQDIETALSMVDTLLGGSWRTEDRLGLREAYVDVYRLAVRLWMASGDQARAFVAVQQAKGRLLHDLLQSAAGLEPPGNTEREIARISTAERRALQEVNPSTDLGAETLRDLRGTRRALLERLLKEEPERALLHGMTRSPDEIAACLLPDEALLDLLHTDQGLAVFVVRPDAVPAWSMTLDLQALIDVMPALNPHDPASGLRQTLDEFRENGRRRPVPALGQLYEWLIRPLVASGALRGVRHLTISATGPLQLLPLAALWYRQEGRVRYLYEDYILSLVPTGTTLWMLRQREPVLSPLSFLGVAPFAPEQQAQSELVTTRAAGRVSENEPGPGFDLLMQTGREIRQIGESVRAACPSAQINLLEGTSATRRRFLELARDARVIVAATHGTAREDQGLLDLGLVFAPNDTESDVIRMREVLRGEISLKRAEHVALTACDLGFSLIHAEETIGFIQAFLSAGARVCLAPLWSVYDAPASDISVIYHQKLLRAGELSAAEAMQEAMTEVRSSGWDHPYFWASMLPCGDGSLRIMYSL